MRSKPRTGANDLNVTCATEEKEEEEEEEGGGGGGGATREIKSAPLLEQFEVDFCERVGFHFGQAVIAVANVEDCVTPREAK
jgi:hypothetical protein